MSTSEIAQVHERLRRPPSWGPNEYGEYMVDMTVESYERDLDALRDAAARDLERAVAAAALLRGLQAARETVARQTDLTELVHFERPSDFRKGVLTCLMALEAQIAEQVSRPASEKGSDHA